MNIEGVLSLGIVTCQCVSRCHCLSGQFIVASIVSVEDVFVERILTFHIGKCFHPAGAFVVEDAVSTHDAVSSKGFGGFKESHLLSVGVVETMLGVDVGGGGTIAYILALYGMNVIDCGVAVLNMHAPWEAISKADLLETKRGYKVFLEKIGM